MIFAPTASPQTLTVVRHMSTIRSMPRMIPMAYSGRGSTPRPASEVLTAPITITMVTRPAPGIPAAPTAARVAVMTTITRSPIDKSMPKTWNKKTVATAS